MANQGAQKVAVTALRHRVEVLQAELAAREVAERHLRETLEAKTPRGWRSWRWVGQLPALLTALAAVGALFYTAEGLAQSRDATTRQNQLALQQNQLAQSGQITDRFNAAATNLGSEVMTIRLGGIYALQRIMVDSPSDQPSVVEVLAAFIRKPSSPVSPSSQPAAQGPPLDVQAALTVLVTRDPGHDSAIRVDLAGANLAGAHFVDANLDGADLTGADLDHARLTRAHLTHADLSHVNLTKAQLDLVDFTGANLDNAQLNGAQLPAARLDDAQLNGAQLQGAYLANAQLSRAHLSGADLSDADLAGAKLSPAELVGAHMARADLTRANLSGSDLTAVDLTDAKLGEADLTGANGSPALLPGADLDGAHLHGVHLEEVDLSGATVKNADLTDADLQGAHLYGADLTDANLDGADLTDAVFSRRPVCSPGASPAEVVACNKP